MPEATRAPLGVRTRIVDPAETDGTAAPLRLIRAFPRAETVLDPTVLPLTTKLTLVPASALASSIWASSWRMPSSTENLAFPLTAGNAAEPLSVARCTFVAALAAGTATRATAARAPMILMVVRVRISAPPLVDCRCGSKVPGGRSGFQLDIGRTTAGRHGPSTVNLGGRVPRTPPRRATFPVEGEGGRDAQPASLRDRRLPSGAGDRCRGGGRDRD